MSISWTRLFDGCLRVVRRHVAQPCAVCGRRSLGGAVCPPCLGALPRLPAARCPVCAQPTPLGEVCGACLKRPPAYERCVAAFRYAPPVDGLVQRFKYGGELPLAHFFAEELAAELTAGLAGRNRPDVVLPLPLHPSRTRERGFNQAVEIGKALCRRLDLPLDYQASQRIRPTPPQAGLSLRERRRNLRGAFACGRDLTGLRVALLDDVMTSGASLEALANAVRRAGARQVEVWVAARAVRS